LWPNAEACRPQGAYLEDGEHFDLAKLLDLFSHVVLEIRIELIVALPSTMPRVRAVVCGGVC
jgi:hypothetical protein